MQLAGNGGLTFSGGAFNNTDGKLQSAGDIEIDPTGQPLINQRGPIAGSGATRID
ncbi:hypothetical protein, partial [Erwinia sp. PsM31]|uniref:hypothetical protein n=1 Tax=Erwinia sp. PsM31 TaxID=3030535 RepID=UPI00345EB62E